MTALFYCLSAISTYLFTTSNGVIILSATSAVIISLIAIRENRKIIKNRETIAMMQDILWDKDYIDARDIFIKARQAGIAQFIGQPDTDEFKAINKIMNHYELLAIGIKRKILSEDIFKEFTKSRLVADWQESKGFVEALRLESKNDNIFCEFENLAENWQEQQ